MKRGDAASTPLIPVDEFKDYVRRVVAVPKKEIDRRLSEERKRHRASAKRRK